MMDSIQYIEKKQMKVELHSDGKNILISEVNTWQQAVKCMNNYLKEINFKSYYMRFWIENNILVIDYGSHSNFFHISDMRIKDFQEIGLSK